MANKTYWIAALILCLPLTSRANLLLTQPLQVEVSAGFPYFFNDSDGKSLHITDVERDILHQKSTRYSPSFHIGLNEEVMECPEWIIGLGPHFYYQQISYKGEVYQFGDSDLNNYTYRLTNKLYNFLFEGRAQFQNSWLQIHNYPVKPYVFAGLGVGYLELEYRDHARFGIPDGEVDVSRNRWKLIGDLGLGFDVDITPCYSLGLKYAYMLTGASRTDSSGGIGLAGPLSINSNNQNLMLSLTYHFYSHLK